MDYYYPFGLLLGEAGRLFMVEHYPPALIGYEMKAQL